MYNLLARATNSAGKLDVTKIDRSRPYYTADSFKSTNSSLMGSLNRLITEVHEEKLKTVETASDLDPYWVTAPIINISKPEYIMVRKRRDQIVAILNDREIEFGVMDKKAKLRLLGPVSLMQLYRGIDVLLDGCPSPKDIQTYVMFVSLLERLERGGDELRKYDIAHYIKKYDGQRAYYAVQYPKGRKNSKHRNKKNRNIKEYEVWDKTKLFWGITVLLETRPPDCTKTAFYLQAFDDWRVCISLP